MLLALASCALFAERDFAGDALRIACTPNSISVDGGPAEVLRNPLAAALERAAPGCAIELEPGDYPAFGIGFAKAAPWNARTSGGTQAAPIVVRAARGARVLPDDRGDTLSINQQIKNAWITFDGLSFVAGYRAAVFFFKLEGDAVHEGFRFWDCDLLGDWDHVKQSGSNSKWGLWAHSLKDFEFCGKTRRAQVRDIRYEHGFYLQNPRGDILLEKIDAARLGRTFVQFTARAGDGEPARGRMQLIDCDIRDTGLSKDDNYKGGAAITIAGGYRDASIRVERCRVRTGFDARLAALTRPGVPYGTSALVCWSGSELTNGALLLLDNDFEFAPGCGDRPLVTLGGATRVEISGHNRFVAGAASLALDLEPLDDGQLRDAALGILRCAAETQIVGGIARRGQVSSLAELVRPK